MATSGLHARLLHTTLPKHVMPRYKKPRVTGTRAYTSLADSPVPQIQESLTSIQGILAMIFFFAQKFGWVHRNIAPTTTFIHRGPVHEQISPSEEEAMDVMVGALVDWEGSYCYTDALRATELECKRKAEVWKAEREERERGRERERERGK